MQIYSYYPLLFCLPFSRKQRKELNDEKETEQRSVDINTTLTYKDLALPRKRLLTHEIPGKTNKGRTKNKDVMAQSF